MVSIKINFVQHNNYSLLCSKIIIENLENMKTNFKFDKIQQKCLYKHIFDRRFDIMLYTLTELEEERYRERILILKKELHIVR